MLDGITIDQLVTVSVNSVTTAGSGGGAVRGRDLTSNGIAGGTYAAVASAVPSAGPAGYLDLAKTTLTPLAWTGSSTSFQLRVTRDTHPTPTGAIAIVTGTPFVGIDGAGGLGLWDDALSELRELVGTVPAGVFKYALEARRTAGTGTIDTTNTVFDFSVVAS